MSKALVRCNTHYGRISTVSVHSPVDNEGRRVSKERIEISYGHIRWESATMSLAQSWTQTRPDGLGGRCNYIAMRDVAESSN